MRLLLVSLLAAFPLVGYGQATITQSTSTVETATIPAAGSLPAIVCTFTSQNPQAATGTQVVCAVGGSNVFSLSAVVAGAGVVGSFNPAGGSVTVGLTPNAATNGVNYQIVATPAGGTAVTKAGSF